MATYSLGCIDCHGNPIADDLPMGPQRERLFNPIGDPRFAMTVNNPNDLTIYTPEHEVTYLRYGDCHKLTAGDEKGLKKALKKAGLGFTVKQAIKDKIPSTMVIEIASGTSRGGAAVACRHFGRNPAGLSQYNRGGVVGSQNDTENRALFGTVDIGAQAAAKIVSKLKHIDTVIFKTASDEIIDAASNIWNYNTTGFPSLPVGLSTEDYYMLHDNLKRLEDTNDGISVRFWKVDKAFLACATFDVICRLDEYEGIPEEITHQRNGGGCSCGNCIKREQNFELDFAKWGQAAMKNCPCAMHKTVSEKYSHLKKGDAFPITNIAGSRYMVTMDVDGA